MASAIKRFVFSEPSGRLNAAIQFLSSLLMIGIYLFGILHGATIGYTLVLAVGFALSGIAESLPSERRRAAGGLRIAASLLLIGFIGLTMLAPEIVI